MYSQVTERPLLSPSQPRALRPDTKFCKHTALLSLGKSCLWLIEATLQNKCSYGDRGKGWPGLGVNQLQTWAQVWRLLARNGAGVYAVQHSAAVRFDSMLHHRINRAESQGYVDQTESADRFICGYGSWLPPGDRHQRGVNQLHFSILPRNHGSAHLPQSKLNRRYLILLRLRYVKVGP